MNVCKRPAIAVVAAVGLAIAASGCGASSASTSTGARISGGTATFAQLPGNLMNYIFPFLPAAYDTLPNATQFSNMIYPPLYWYGGPGKVELNESESMAELPVIKYVGRDTVASVTLKGWKWSNGDVITSRDVEFWFNLLKAEKIKWALYVKGEIPDNVVSFKVDNASRFTVTFDGHFGHLYMINELSNLEAIPQKVWDKTSTSAPVGNYDMTSAGAAAVYTYLNAQSLDIKTYATNPLWQVVDGAWKIQAYNPATTAMTLVRNKQYSGPVTGSITHFQYLQYTSSASEFADLLSGRIDFGFLPTTDIPQVARLESSGYKVVGWPAYGFTFVPLNFANPTVGPLFRQLYIRQALEYEVNQPLDIKAVLKGYGYPTDGPGPAVPPNKLVSKQQSSIPYPYSSSKASSLLTSHGWKIDANGVETCERPGTGAGECGASIPRGKQLLLKMTYASGIPFILSEVQAFESSLSRIGIKLVVAGEPFSQDFAQWATCSKASCWQILYWASPSWIYNDNTYGPMGDVLFYSSGASNGGQYDSPEANKLLNAVHTGPLSSLYAYENYISKDLPMLWFPNTDQEIAVVKDSLHGELPLDPDQNIYPQDWYLTK